MFYFAATRLQFTTNHFDGDKFKKKQKKKKSSAD